MELILVRHGETLYNKENIFRGSAEVPLNERGLLQAKLLAQALAREKLSAIYSSPQFRAKVTAQEIARKQNLPVIEDARLADLNFGDWQGKTLEQVKSQYSLLYQQWLENPSQVEIPGGENLKIVENNIIDLLAELEKNYPTGKIALITHRLVVKVILVFILGMGEKGFWKLKPEVASISRIEKKADWYVLTSFNQTCHLKEESSPLADF